MVSLAFPLLTLLRALAEIAGMFLLAQGALHFLVGGRHQQNVVYQLFCIITRPVLSAARWLMPKAISDRHLPLLAFFLLFCFWIALAYLRQLVCASNACG